MPAGRDACGGPLPGRPGEPPERDALHGMKEVADYAGFSEKVIKRLAHESGFPLAYIADRWVSSRSMVDGWFRAEIEKAVNKNLGAVSPS